MPGVRVRGGVLSGPGEHRFLAVFGLLGQVDQNQAARVEAPEPEVGDVRSGRGGQGPAVALQASAGLVKDGVDLGTFHGIRSSSVRHEN